MKVMSLLSRPRPWICSTQKLVLSLF